MKLELDKGGQKQYTDYSTDFSKKTQTSLGGREMGMDSIILEIERALMQEPVHSPEFPNLLTRLSDAFSERLKFIGPKDPQDTRNGIYYFELALALRESSSWLHSPQSPMDHPHYPYKCPYPFCARLFSTLEHQVRVFISLAISP